MKNQRSSARDQLGRIAAYGVIAILVAALAEILITVLAFSVGIAVWIAKDFVSGFTAGIVTFGAGHVLGYFILTVWEILPEKSEQRDGRDV